MKTVIEMACEAGFEAKRGWGWRDFAPEDIFAAAVNITREIERFAELVRADEREACAKVCETLGVHPALNVFAGGPDWYKHGKECAAAIRARGNT